MEFTIVNQKLEEKNINLEDTMDWYDFLVLYFYPKDNTSGCSIEAKEFSDLKDVFAKYKAKVIWVSKDSAKSHCNFISKIWINFDLLVDTEQILHNKFGVIWEKSMYGKKYLGTVRSTFVLDKDMNILKERKNVKATWHANEVLNFIKSLKN